MTVITNNSCSKILSYELDIIHQKSRNTYSINYFTISLIFFFPFCNKITPLTQSLDSITRLISDTATSFSEMPFCWMSFLASPRDPASHELTTTSKIVSPSFACTPPTCSTKAFKKSSASFQPFIPVWVLSASFSLCSLSFAKTNSVIACACSAASVPRIICTTRYARAF